MFNETTGIDMIGSQMCCKLLTVIEPKARGLESLPDICPIPPRARWLGSASRGSDCWKRGAAIRAPHPDVSQSRWAFSLAARSPARWTALLLAPDHSVNNWFFQFLLRSWQSNPWQPGKSQQWGRRSFVLETCIFWRCMFNWCGYYFSWKEGHYQINTLPAALVRSLMNSCNWSLALIKRNMYHVDPDLQPSFI